MKTKVCTGKFGCGKEKPISEFHKNPQGKFGVRANCKKCVKIYHYQRYDEYKEKIKKQTQEYKEKYPWKQIFNSIKRRCNNSEDQAHNYYGGRGIKCLITEDEIKFLWFRDKAYLMKKPSIDRKENADNYILANCQFIEMVENGVKNKRKIILQLDLKGNFIKEWNSLRKVERELSISHSSIGKCAKGNINYNHAGGFKWRYK